MGWRSGMITQLIIKLRFFSHACDLTDPQTRMWKSEVLFGLFSL